MMIISDLFPANHFFNDATFTNKLNQIIWEPNMCISMWESIEAVIVTIVLLIAFYSWQHFAKITYVKALGNFTEIRSGMTQLFGKEVKHQIHTAMELYCSRSVIQNDINK